MDMLQLAFLIITTGVILLILGIFFTLSLLTFKTSEGVKEQVSDIHNRIYYSTINDKYSNESDGKLVY